DDSRRTYCPWPPRIAPDTEPGSSSSGAEQENSPDWTDTWQERNASTGASAAPCTPRSGPTGPSLSAHPTKGIRARDRVQNVLNLIMPPPKRNGSTTADNGASTGSPVTYEDRCWADSEIYRKAGYVRAPTAPSDAGDGS